MSMALIHEVYEEVRKLMIAGSDMVSDNFKLKKILPAMQKSGASVPVFTRVAEAMEAAINPGTGKSAEKLLELANIVNTIVYTQGETGIQGEIEKVDCLGLSYPTNTPYRKLNPLITALTTKGSGRLEIIRSFYEQENDQDLRLIIPLIEALGDGYPEIANLAGDILKECGQAIIPALKKQFDLNGGKRDAKIIDLISDLAGKTEKEFYLYVIENSREEVKVSAIKALKDLPEYEDLLIELADDKKKEIRAAALSALSRMQTDSTVNCLLNAVRGKDRDIAIEPIKLNDAPKMAQMLLEEAEKSLQSIQASDMTSEQAEATVKKQVEYFITVLDCMLGKKEPEIFEFLKKCIELPTNLPQFKINNAKDTVIRTAARNILALANEAAYDFLLSSINKYDNLILDYSFEAAIRSKSPEYVFEHYSPLLKKGPKSFERKEITKVISYYSDFEPEYQIWNYYPVHDDEIKWDQRWAKFLLELDEISTGCRLVTKGDTKCIQIMLEKLKKHRKFGDQHLTNLILGLFQAGYEKVSDAIIEVLEFNIKDHNKYSFRYYLDNFIELIKLLPADDAQSIKAFATEHNVDGLEKLFEAVWHLKNKNKK